MCKHIFEKFCHPWQKTFYHNTFYVDIVDDHEKNRVVGKCDNVIEKDPNFIRSDILNSTPLFSCGCKTITIVGIRNIFYSVILYRAFLGLKIISARFSQNPLSKKEQSSQDFIILSNFPSLVEYFFATLLDLVRIVTFGSGNRGLALYNIAITYCQQTSINNLYTMFSWILNWEKVK